ncbi:MAG: hypothetical protein NC203_01150 [Firmicutes bacterium]|nr:hypothetical protein [[Eubacterium] siraeum]MCM1486947.1 hypothetical protein [Bacillota bacterium]
MAYNVNPTTSMEETRQKYAEYFSDSSSNDMLSMETFFKLLMAEMTAQDPLEPTSNTEFVSQLASFSALQTNSDSLYYNTVAYASSLAGKTVTVATVGTTADDIKIDTGVVTGVDISDSSDIEIMVNGNRYKLSQVMNVANGTGTTIGGSAGATASNNNGAYAVSLIGKSVTVNQLNEDGSSILDTGIVDSIEVENGEYRVVVNGLGYRLDSVVKVRNDDGYTEAGAYENTETKTI